MSVREEIFELYTLYGLEKASETSKAIVFTFSNGYFSNAEIVSFGENKENKEKLMDEYQNVGYATRIVEFDTIEKMHEHLFKGFFSVDTSNKRLRHEYNKFCELQTEKIYNSSQSISVKYEYVEPSFLWGNQLEKENLIEKVEKKLLSYGPQLIIMEAAAGFGKTCASYELINKISKKNEQIAPLFTELSKNRKATLFRYVLLDEIDKKFTSLSSKLVLYEIKNGKVPLIIDGFDELISRSNKLIDAHALGENEEAQTMLDTIAELFDGETNSKIILTSRKSSIFTGDIFKKWQEDKLKNCTVTRVAIEEPTVEDWIGTEKMEILKERKIPLSSITNPILLAFLKNMSVLDFCEKCKDIESVIKYYFDSLLEREKERQALLLNADEQFDMMVSLTKEMLDFDISSEESAFIKDIFIEINRDYYKKIRERYIMIEERPTEEEFAAKLAGHALLNRISPNKNEIGFINDFVFGIMITDNIINNNYDIKSVSNRHIDIACTSAMVRTEKIRNRLFGFIQEDIDRLNYEEILSVDLKLKKGIMHDYEYHYFSNLNFGSEICFDKDNKFLECTFTNCTFSMCTIATSNFIQCKFYDCYFYNVKITLNTNYNTKLIFGGCLGYEEFAKLSAIEIVDETNIDYEKIVLSYFWNGGRYSKGKVHQQNIFKNHTNEEIEELTLAIEKLKKDDIISKDGQFFAINVNKMKEIRRKLGW